MSSQRLSSEAMIALSCTASAKETGLARPRPARGAKHLAALPPSAFSLEPPADSYLVVSPACCLIADLSGMLEVDSAAGRALELVKAHPPTQG